MLRQAARDAVCSPSRHRRHKKPWQASAGGGVPPAAHPQLPAHLHVNFGGCRVVWAVQVLDGSGSPSGCVRAAARFRLLRRDVQMVRRRQGGACARRSPARDTLLPQP
mgnify:CR=1 FL=1